ncbi:hypothetical protein Fmac_017714 [Flemingia macrophylla]|uniref:BHLH domain-containing protein n=1 Tax=Flemingia macrophylla TaxID=520843 RepID=A0ABD1M300_9FABA
MEDSLENWISHLDDVFNESHSSIDGQELVGGIPEHERGKEHPSNNSPTNSTVSFEEATSLSRRSGTPNTLHKSNSSNSIKSLQKSCATYLLSFHNSSAEPITHVEPSPKALGPYNKRIGVKGDSEWEAWMPQPRKKVRRSLSQTQNHIIAERKRRQELTGSIIALSATIPGLKKMDKAYVLREAVNYTKQLQERVKELENQIKDSATLMRSSNESNGNCETKRESLFEVVARVLDEEVFIGIHCEKQKDTVFKIHALLGKLHLSVNTSSVLPFGNSTLIINLIARVMQAINVFFDPIKWY